VGSLKIIDYCTRNHVSVPVHSRLWELMEAFVQHRLDIVCVTTVDNQFRGIVSKYDLYRALLKGRALDDTVDNLIRTDVVTVSAENTLDEAKTILLKYNVAHALVVDEGRVIGVIRKADLIRGFLDQTEILASELEGLLENLEEGVVSVDLEGQITMLNKAAETLLQVKRKGITGHKVATALPSLAAGFVAAQSELRTHGPVQVTVSDSIVLASFSPILHAGKCSGVMAVLRDVTVLERIAKELSTTKDLEETLRHAVALSYDGIILTDTNGYIRIANDSAADFLEQRHQDLIGQSWSRVVPEIPLLQVQSENGPRMESRILTIHGRHCIVTQESMIRAGRPLGVIIKIIYQQLGQWRDVLKRLERVSSVIPLANSQSEEPSDAFHQIAGTSLRITELKRVARVAAPTVSTVLITGKSGTGKELFAQAIHELSGRRGNFIKVNCAAFPPDLLESEFFGYAEGAFTGARRGGKPGKFELADNGTLFLDEIGDMPLPLQAKLLRVLETREFERVGDVKVRQVNVRVVAATNQDLLDLVYQGRFREDLYYRLHVVCLEIPSLEERLEDLPAICESIIRTLNQRLDRSVLGVSPKALAQLRARSWPGNVRELRNVLEFAMTLHDVSYIEPEHLPQASIHPTRIAQPQPLPIDDELIDNEADEESILHRQFIEDREREYILRMLRQAGGNKSLAARQMGIGRATLYQKMRKHHIKG
jgi:PAS domain S-box-containing protein